MNKKKTARPLQMLSLLLVLVLTLGPFSGCAQRQEQPEPVQESVPALAEEGTLSAEELREFSSYLLGIMMSNLAEEQYQGYSQYIEELLAQEAAADDAPEAGEADAPVATVMGYNALEGSTFPEKLDLRDWNGKNYVTPVKLQNPFGSCWSFATIAAAETSILTALDQPVVEGEPTLDLSEHHLAWFTYMPQTDGDQIGEGLLILDEDGETTDDPMVVMNAGGLYLSAEAMLKSGVGVYPESKAPYQPAEAAKLDYASTDELVADFRYLIEQHAACGGDMEAVEALAKADERLAKILPCLEYIAIGADLEPCGWTAAGDWSLDESLHFGQAFQLLETRTLPSPKYGDPQGVNAIKGELSEGRAVAITYYADASQPGDLDNGGREDDYIRYDNEDGTWAQYTYEDREINHAVCVVGWDDAYPAANFNSDPGLSPPGDGAWIVKNSWGSAQGQFPHLNAEGWGTDGTGYFYLSYYDCSVDAAESLLFDVDGLVEDYIADEHDFMVADIQAIPFSSAATNGEPLSYANVFAAEFHQELSSIGVDIASGDTEVTCQVYKLKEGYKNPQDGELVDTITLTTVYPGYHCLPLNRALELQKGESYSIVVTEQKGDDYIMSIHAGNSKEGLLYFLDLYHGGGGEGSALPPTYNSGVVNPGESYVRIAKVWIDLADAIAKSDLEAEAHTGIPGGGTAWDNFSIKGFSKNLEGK